MIRLSNCFRTFPTIRLLCESAEPPLHLKREYLIANLWTYISSLSNLPASDAQVAFKEPNPLPISLFPNT